MEIFQKIKIELEEYDLKDVADNAEVSIQTLRNWISGKVQNPHLRTIYHVAEAMGYRVELVKNNSIKLAA